MPTYIYIYISLYHCHLPIEFSALTADFQATDAPSLLPPSVQPSVAIHAGELADDVAQGELPDTVIERRRRTRIHGVVFNGSSSFTGWWLSPTPLKNMNVSWDNYSQ